MGIAYSNFGLDCEYTQGLVSKSLMIFQKSVLIKKFSLFQRLGSDSKKICKVFQNDVSVYLNLAYATFFCSEVFVVTFRFFQCLCIIFESPCSHILVMILTSFVYIMWLDPGLRFVNRLCEIYTRFSYHSSGENQYAF